MKIIVLAAGVGRRLGPAGQDNPKCFVELQGKKIIDRYFEIFADLGIGEVVMVVGYAREKIMEYLGDRRNGVDIRYVENDRYRRGNILSVQLAHTHFTDDLVFMDADVVFHPDLLKRLIESPLRNAYLLDPKHDVTGEEMLVAAKEGRVLENARKLSGEGYDAVGEGLGFLKMCRETAGVYGRMLTEAIEAGRLDDEYEDVLKDLLVQEWVGYVPTGGLPWREIDFPEDIEKATADILPRIPW